MIHLESLAAVTGALADSADQVNGGLRSPGQLPKHYSPKAKLWVLEWENEEALRARLPRWA
jgi:hypothetical protein